MYFCAVSRVPPHTSSVVCCRSGMRSAKLIRGAGLIVVKDGPHCIPWTHAQEVNAELLSFLSDKSVEPMKEVA